MPTHVAPRRDFHGLEVRRKQAARLFAAGRETQGAIARRLGVSRQSVMRWYQAWRSGGREALRAAGRAGRKDRKSTRLNSSHTVISYAVFCLKKKKGSA